MGYRLYAIKQKTIEQEIKDKDNECLFSAYDSDVFENLDTYESQIPKFYLTRKDLIGLIHHMFEFKLNGRKKMYHTNEWNKIQNELCYLIDEMIKSPYDEIQLEAY